MYFADATTNGLMSKANEVLMACGDSLRVDQEFLISPAHLDKLARDRDPQALREWYAWANGLLSERRAARQISLGSRRGTSGRRNRAARRSKGGR